MIDLLQMNKSKMYLLPLFINTIKVNQEFILSIKNTYLFHNSHLDEKCIGISFKPSILKNPKFINDIQKLILDDSFIQIEKTDTELMYLFEFPEKYFQEYFKFLKGKYSQFPRRSKEIILKFWTELQSKNEFTILDLIYIKQVLFKDNKLKLHIEEELNVELPVNAELESIPEKSEETFTNKIMKESVEIHE